MGKEDAMKVLRSVTRRGFEVGTAGWFTITSPRRWFSASRLPGGFQDFIGQPKRTEARVVTSALAPTRDQEALERANSQEATIPLQIISPNADDRHLMRFVLIALVAAALTLAVLWWMIPANPWRDH